MRPRTANISSHPFPSFPINSQGFPTEKNKKNHETRISRINTNGKRRTCKQRGDKIGWASDKPVTAVGQGVGGTFAVAKGMDTDEKACAKGDSARSEGLVASEAAAAGPAAAGHPPSPRLRRDRQPRSVGGGRPGGGQKRSQNEAILGWYRGGFRAGSGRQKPAFTGNYGVWAVLSGWPDEQGKLQNEAIWELRYWIYDLRRGLVQSVSRLLAGSGVAVAGESGVDATALPPQSMFAVVAGEGYRRDWVRGLQFMVLRVKDRAPGKWNLWKGQ